MATFIEASMANGAPAETALVNPLSTSSPRLLTARTAWRAIGSSSPNGAGVAPRLWYVAWKWQLTIPGHDGSAGEVDHPVVGTGLDDRAGAHRGDPVAVHHHVGVGEDGAVAVDDGGRAVRTSRVMGPRTTLMAPDVRSAATRKASAASSRGKRWVITAAGRSGGDVEHPHRLLELRDPGGGGRR